MDTLRNRQIPQQVDTTGPQYADTTGPHIRRKVLRNGHLYVIAKRLGAQVLLGYGRYRLRPPGGETGT
jgi:hypothetical protein